MSNTRRGFLGKLFAAPVVAKLFEYKIEVLEVPEVRLTQLPSPQNIGSPSEGGNIPTYRSVTRWGVYNPLSKPLEVTHEGVTFILPPKQARTVVNGRVVPCPFPENHKR